jgi:hypothetical protein
MDEQTTDAAQPAPGARGMRERIGQRAWVRSAAWVGGGLVAGGILAGTVTAAAADDPAPATSAPGAAAADDRDGRHHGGGPGAGEEPLTGDTADSAEAAVLEEYPEATIQRLETDADGVYEAHITTADGEELTVALDEDYAITGTQEGRGGGRGHGGGPGAGEEPLTGDTADSVEAAVLEEYPDATIERLETDADGVYEAHITTADGDRVTVELGDDFAITGTE